MLKKSQEGKTILLQQTKLIKITDREVDGWEFVKCYFSHDLASNSIDEKQLSRTRKVAALNKKKKEATKQRLERRNQFGRALPSFTKTFESFKRSNKVSRKLLRTNKICGPAYFHYSCPIKISWIRTIWLS